MDVRVVEKHDGEGVFPLFAKGTAVADLKACKAYAHWCSCAIDGYETYVPDAYVVDGVLAREYNPTEFVAEKGQIVALVHIVFEWLYVKDAHGTEGWLPASKAMSV